MATTVSMPQLGESIAEGTIGRLLKAPGDRVERDEAIVEVMTDKVNAEIPSPVAGVIEQIVVQEGDVVPIGAALLVIGDGSGLGAQSAAPAAASAAPATPAAAPPPPPPPPAAPVAVAEPPAAPPPPVAPETNGAPKRASPFVRSLAGKYGINLAQVSGSGLGGRVTKDDILGYIERHGAQPVAAAPAAPPVPAAPAAPPTPPAPPAPVAPAAPPAPAAPAVASATAPSARTRS